MIYISIENADTAGRAVTVTGASGDELVHRDLQPGECAKIALGRTTLLSLCQTRDQPGSQIEAC